MTIMSSALQKYISKSKYVIISLVLEKITFFVVYLVLARTIPVNEYGIVTAIFAFTNILNGIFDFGFPFYFQREAASNRNLENKFSLVLLLKFISFFIYIIIPILYFHPENAINIWLILLISSITFLSSINSIFNSLLFGKGDYKISAIILSISRACLFITFIFFIIFKFSIEIILFSFIFSAIIHLILLSAQLHKYNLWFTIEKLDLKTIKQILRSSLPIGLGLIFVLLYDRIDILLIEKIIGFEAVAVYAVAYSLYRTFQLLSNSILIPGYTYFSNSYYSKHFISFAELKSITIILIGLSLASSLFLYLFAEEIINTLYGNKYLASIESLKFLSIAIPGVFFNNLTGVISNSIRKELIPMIGTGLGAVLNISLGLVLISNLGIIGAVITTIATEYFVFIVQFMLLFISNKKKQIIL